MTSIRAVCKSWPARAAAALVLGAPGAALGSDELAPEYWELYGDLELESTVFFEDARFPGQHRDTVSLAGSTTFQAEWLDGDLTFKFTPFLRVDSADDRRTHGDIRELKFDYASGDWSFTLGADTVFWGKTEVVHLVDIVNQTDQVEDLDDEDRLGQPLIRAAYLSEIGEVSAFLLPFFRERPFAGRAGRLRVQPPVDTGRPVFETSAAEFTPSFALRYTGAFGPLDLGLSGFHGLSRDPSFVFDGQSLRPVYSRISQGGVDFQITDDATLWKFEGIYRAGQRNARTREEGFFAATGGLEHTLFGLFGSNADLGLIAEYAWDQRGKDALTAFQNDAILGMRLALNDTADTAILLTGSVDLADGSTGLRLEAEHRIADNWKIEVESIGFLHQDRANPASALSDDSFVRAKLRWFF